MSEKAFAISSIVSDGLPHNADRVDVWEWCSSPTEMTSEGRLKGVNAVWSCQLGEDPGWKVRHVDRLCYHILKLWQFKLNGSEESAYLGCHLLFCEPAAQRGNAWPEPENQKFSRGVQVLYDIAVRVSVFTVFTGSWLIPSLSDLMQRRLALQGHRRRRRGTVLLYTRFRLLGLRRSDRVVKNY